MKRVVSVSLGSKAGDFVREITLDGESVRLERQGVDGDMEAARERIRALDGVVDAIGLGGIDIYLYVGAETFVIGDGQRLAEEAKTTPVVDGSGLKNTLERRVVRGLAERGVLPAGTPVLMPSALDRFGMAEEFGRLGCPCVFGDLIFNIGFNYPMTELSELEELARKYRKRLLTVPFHMLYPTGDAQNAKQADSRYANYYEAAAVIAGDSHLIQRHLPPRVAPGKGIVCNTTRPHTLARFAEAGIDWVATTTPDLDGVSGGTNLMEAALIALMGKAPADVTGDDYDAWIERLGWHGAFHNLQDNNREN